ncbi:MAG TPA: hypothetical protein VGR92_07615 [Steroidobacteraceae bacterium]|nr:hypothetical protein [Steroidobacteraceae bacterium]
MSFDITQHHDRTAPELSQVCRVARRGQQLSCFARALRRLTIATSRRTKQLRVRPDAMQDHRTPTDPIDEKKIGTQVAYREAAPVTVTLSEPMFTEGRWEFLARNQGVEDVLKRLDVEFGVFTRVPVIALKAREND